MTLHPAALGPQHEAPTGFTSQEQAPMNFFKPYRLHNDSIIDTLRSEIWTAAWVVGTMIAVGIIVAASTPAHAGATTTSKGMAALIAYDTVCEKLPQLFTEHYVTLVAPTLASKISKLGSGKSWTPTTRWVPQAGAQP